MDVEMADATGPSTGEAGQAAASKGDVESPAAMKASVGASKEGAASSAGAGAAESGAAGTAVEGARAANKEGVTGDVGDSGAFKKGPEGAPSELKSHDEAGGQAKEAQGKAADGECPEGEKEVKEDSRKPPSDESSPPSKNDHVQEQPAAPHAGEQEQPGVDTRVADEPAATGRKGEQRVAQAGNRETHMMDIESGLQPASGIDKGEEPATAGNGEQPGRDPATVDDAGKATEGIGDSNGGGDCAAGASDPDAIGAEGSAEGGDEGGGAVSGGKGPTVSAEESEVHGNEARDGRGSGSANAGAEDEAQKPCKAQKKQVSTAAEEKKRKRELDDLAAESQRLLRESTNVRFQCPEPARISLRAGLAKIREAKRQMVKMWSTGQIPGWEGGVNIPYDGERSPPKLRSTRGTPQHGHTSNSIPRSASAPTAPSAGPKRAPSTAGPGGFPFTGGSERARKAPLPQDMLEVALAQAAAEGDGDLEIELEIIGERKGGSKNLSGQGSSKKGPALKGIKEEPLAGSAAAGGMGAKAEGSKGPAAAKASEAGAHRGTGAGAYRGTGARAEGAPRKSEAEWQGVLEEMGPEEAEAALKAHRMKGSGAEEEADEEIEMEGPQARGARGPVPEGTALQETALKGGGEGGLGVGLGLRSGSQDGKAGQEKGGVPGKDGGVPGKEGGASAQKRCSVPVTPAGAGVIKRRVAIIDEDDEEEEEEGPGEVGKDVEMMDAEDGDEQGGRGGREEDEDEGEEEEEEESLARRRAAALVDDEAEEEDEEGEGAEEDEEGEGEEGEEEGEDEGIECTADEEQGSDEVRECHRDWERQREEQSEREMELGMEAGMGFLGGAPGARWGRARGRPRSSFGWGDADIHSSPSLAPGSSPGVNDGAGAFPRSMSDTGPLGLGSDVGRPGPAGAYLSRRQQQFLAAAAKQRKDGGAGLASVFGRPGSMGAGSGEGLGERGEGDEGSEGKGEGKAGSAEGEEREEEEDGEGDEGEECEEDEEGEGGRVTKADREFMENLRKRRLIEAQDRLEREARYKREMDAYNARKKREEEELQQRIKEGQKRMNNSLQMDPSFVPNLGTYLKNLEKGEKDGKKFKFQTGRSFMYGDRFGDIKPVASKPYYFKVQRVTKEEKLAIMDRQQKENEEWRRLEAEEEAREMATPRTPAPSTAPKRSSASKASPATPFTGLGAGARGIGREPPAPQPTLDPAVVSAFITAACRGTFAECVREHFPHTVRKKR